jgi:arylsulfatase A-like enzyme
VCDEYGGTRMICDGRYKLVRRYPAGPDELFDIERDPGEYKNFITDPAYAYVIASLDKRLEKWFEKYTNPAFDGRKENVTGRGQITSHIFK